MAGDINQKARESAKRAQSMSPAVQYAIVAILQNTPNGAFWGFTTMKDIESHFDVLKEEPNITARKLGNACLLEVNPSFLLRAVQAIDPEALTQKDLMDMNKMRADGYVDFEKFLISKGKKLDNSKNKFGGTVGIYCINTVTTISYKGIVYPAFRVNMGDALKLLSEYGYTVQVGSNFIPAEQAMNSGQMLWTSVQLAPTKTGLFINIQSTLSPEEMKHKEALFRQKYNLDAKNR